jgi:hypothetical protein
MTSRTDTRPAALAAVLIALLAAACGGGSGPAGHAPPAAKVTWIIGGTDLALLEKHVPGIVRNLYDNPNAYVIGDRTGHQDQVLPGSRAHPTLAYASYAQFANDAEHDRIDPVVDTVVYDPEDWARTPARERAHPQLYIHRFIHLAHEAGFHAIVAPARDLAMSAARCRKRQGEKLDAAFLRCRFAADAVGADMILLQTGADELAAGGLRRFIEKAVAQIRRAQPHVRLVGLISTLPPSHVKAWPGGLVRAMRTELSSLDGIELNFTPQTAPLAADYLRDLQRSGAVS